MCLYSEPGRIWSPDHVLQNMGAIFDDLCAPTAAQNSYPKHIFARHKDPMMMAPTNGSTVAQNDHDRNTTVAFEIDGGCSLIRFKYF
jgi:hypothetical protein